MTKEFTNLINKDKNDLNAGELMTVLGLSRIKKNENSIWTNIALIASPIVIIFGIVNMITPIFVNTFDVIINYLATIPAFLNIGIKIRETILKEKFMKEFDLSRKELKAIFKSDQMKVFEELIKDIEAGKLESLLIEKPDTTFSDFEFKEELPDVDLKPAKERVEEHKNDVAKKSNRRLIKKIIKNMKFENNSKNSNNQQNDENNHNLNL